MAFGISKAWVSLRPLSRFCPHDGSSAMLSSERTYSGITSMCACNILATDRWIQSFVDRFFPRPLLYWPIVPWLSKWIRRRTCENLAQIRWYIAILARHFLPNLYHDCMNSNPVATSKHATALPWQWQYPSQKRHPPRYWGLPGG